MLNVRFKNDYDIYVCMDKFKTYYLHLDSKKNYFCQDGKFNHFNVVFINDFEIFLQKNVHLAIKKQRLTAIIRKSLCFICGKEYELALAEHLKKDVFNL